MGLDYPKGRVRAEHAEPAEVEFGGADLLPVEMRGRTSVDGVPLALQVRESGEFADRGFFLSARFVWRIVRDDEGHLVLVPTRRE